MTHPDSYQIEVAWWAGYWQHEAGRPPLPPAVPPLAKAYQQGYHTSQQIRGTP